MIYSGTRNVSSILGRDYLTTRHTTILAAMVHACGVSDVTACSCGLLCIMVLVEEVKRLDFSPKSF